MALSVVPAALASWTSGVGGSANAAAATLGAPPAPAAVVSGTLLRTVTLSWTAVPGATAYRVRRYDTLGALTGVGGTCAGSVTATTCADSGLLPGGTWTYAVTATASSWQGAESPQTTATT